MYRQDLASGSIPSLLQDLRVLNMKTLFAEGDPIVAALLARDERHHVCAGQGSYSSSVVVWSGCDKERGNTARLLPREIPMMFAYHLLRHGLSGLGPTRMQS